MTSCLNTRAQLCCDKAKQHIARYEISGKVQELEFANQYLFKAHDAQETINEPGTESDEHAAGTDNS